MTRFAFKSGLLAILAATSISTGYAATEGGYAIVDTGQTSTFGNDGTISSSTAAKSYPGQDAAYSGNQANYVDNGDGTVTDLVTGLMWEKGYSTMSWSDAQDNADNVTTGGYDDWRVPTIKELYSLIDFSGNQGSGVSPESATAPSNAEPFIDTSAFDFEYPTTGRYIDAQYVTSTVYTSDVMNGQQCFFGVNFADGRIKCYPTSSSRHAGGSWEVRYVRGNADYGDNDFTDNGDGTVTDTATGLMWSTIDSGDVALNLGVDGAMTWQDALQFVESSTYAGYDDWRLPDAKELQSIVDYTRSPDATGSAAIDPVFDITSVTNAAGELDWPEFWTSTSFEPGRDAVVVYFGRAMGYFSAGGQAADFIDVHGAGAQRTDPKTGEDSYGKGPQGDVRYVNNFVRLVRDAG